MAYTPFSETAPDGTSGTGTTYSSADNANQLALQDMVEFAQVRGIDVSTSGGTGDEPVYYIFTRHGGAILGRATNTWSGGKLVGQKWEKWNGASYDAILAADQVLTYDASLNITATTYGGGLGSIVWSALAKARKAMADLLTHAASTVSGGAHSAGTMAAQNANAVAISGGYASLAYEREAKIAKGNVSGSTAVDWAASGLCTLTVTNAAATLTWSNLPSGVVGYMTLEVTNGAIATSLFTAQKPGGTALSWTNPGKDIVTLMCHDGATVEVVGFAKDVK